MLSTLAWSPFLLTLVPHAFKFLLDALTKSILSDRPRKGNQELHHRILLDLQKVGSDDSIYGQQIKRLLLDELVPAAKNDPREAVSVLKLKNWRELVSRTERVAHLVEIRADAAGVPRVLWASNWARGLKGHPAIAFAIALMIYAGAFTTTTFLGISYALAWQLDGWRMPPGTLLLGPAMLFSGTIALFGFKRSMAILDAWSACRYAAKLRDADLLSDPEPLTPPRAVIKPVRRAASKDAAMFHIGRGDLRRLIARAD